MYLEVTCQQDLDSLIQLPGSDPHRAFNIRLFNEPASADTGYESVVLVITAFSIPEAPFTRYNLLSNRLSNVCIHDTTGSQTRC